VIAGVAAALCGRAPAQATPAPQPVVAMIVKAAESGDGATLATVVSIAKQTNPDSLSEIDALARSLAPERQTAAAPPPPAVAAAPEAAAIAAAVTAPAAGAPQEPARAALAGWKGSVELGGSLAQGESDVAGAYGVLDLLRAGAVWSQRATLRGDYQQTDGRTTTQRFSLAYEPRAKLSASRYAFGLAQYENDRMLGISNRYTVGAGLGLQLADRPDFKLAVDFGPALRLTDHRDGDEEGSVAARGSLNFRWLATERLTIAQEGALYSEESQASAKSITSLETLLFGPLKARLSYNLQYERTPGAARTLDTTTRASLLYAF
jgi:putative salt-induced outer membrane protein